jgi:hypothetical protein
MAETATLELTASDISGQKTVRARNVPADATVGEVLQTLLDKLGLERNDADGRPLSFHPRLEREGRHLNDSEIAGEALEPGDHLVIAPNIDAG